MMRSGSERFVAAIAQMLRWGDVECASLCFDHLCRIGVLEPSSRSQFAWEAPDDDAPEPGLRLALGWISKHQAVSEALLLLVSLPDAPDAKRLSWMRALDALVSMPPGCPEDLQGVYDAVGERDLLRAHEVSKVAKPTPWGEYLEATLASLSEQRLQQLGAHADDTLKVAKVEHDSVHAGSVPSTRRAFQNPAVPAVKSFPPPRQEGAGVETALAISRTQTDIAAARAETSQRLFQARASCDLDIFAAECRRVVRISPDGPAILDAIDVLLREANQVKATKTQMQTIPLSGRGAAAFQLRMLNLAQCLVLYERLALEDASIEVVRRAVDTLLRVIAAEPLETMEAGASRHGATFQEEGAEPSISDSEPTYDPASDDTSNGDALSNAFTDAMTWPGGSLGNPPIRSDAPSLPPAPAVTFSGFDSFSQEITRVGGQGYQPMSFFDDEVTLVGHTADGASDLPKTPKK